MRWDLLSGCVGRPAEVRQLGHLVHDYYVLRFQVSVDHSVLVQINQSRYDLPQIVGGLGLAEVLLPAQNVKQRGLAEL